MKKNKNAPKRLEDGRKTMSVTILDILIALLIGEIAFIGFMRYITKFNMDDDSDTKVRACTKALRWQRR